MAEPDGAQQRKGGTMADNHTWQDCPFGDAIKQMQSDITDIKLAIARREARDEAGTAWKAALMWGVGLLAGGAGAIVTRLLGGAVK